MRRRLAGLACAALLLSACGASLSPEEKLRDLTSAVVAAANDRDPSTLRAAVAELSSEIDNQERRGDISANQATVLQRFLADLEKSAPLLTSSPTPSPTPSATPSPTPSPTPSESPTPSPEPSPTPSETPAPTAEPSPTETPSVVPTGIGVGLGQSSPQASAKPSSAKPNAKPSGKASSSPAASAATL